MTIEQMEQRYLGMTVKEFAWHVHKNCFPHYRPSMDRRSLKMLADAFDAEMEKLGDPRRAWRG